MRSGRRGWQHMDADLVAQVGEVSGTAPASPGATRQQLAASNDEVTEAVIAAVQAAGTCWAGGTTWHGRRAMRLSVSDIATTREDIEISASAIPRCARSV
jgi:hypothetical protein